MAGLKPCTLALGLIALAATAQGGDAPRPAVDFNREIRPILSDHCFRCHGPDENERQSGLRLDNRAAALEPADSGEPAIVPGEAGKSPLVRRIHSEKKGFRMPPPESNKVLSEREKDLLTRWVAEGARYQTHWSFVAPRRPAVPEVAQAAWPRNEVDRFLLARLEAEGLKPSPEADRTTLIRRLTLDLTGLPPTIAEVDAFLADDRPDAYERVVERLLNSPRYGERLALDWLDSARYADTHGFHIDSGRDMTRWREWVIDAFNTNMPFDRFTVEQIAGDLLPDATVAQKVASGFNRNHMINFEGGAVPQEYHTAYVIDRVNTTGTVWMGLTVGCTQCHDHKFDPITQKEYYGLYAFFYNVPEQGLDGSKGNAAPLLKVPTPEQQQKLDLLETELNEVQAVLDRPSASLEAAQAEWEESATARRRPDWQVLEPIGYASAGGATLARLEDGSIRATGTNPAKESYRVVARGDLCGATALRVEALTDDGLTNRGPGRSVNGNIVLTDVKVDAAGPLKLAGASADFSQPGFAVAQAIDGRPETGWGIDSQTGRPHAAVFSFDRPIADPGDGLLGVTLEFQSPFASHQPGRFRLSITTAADPHDSHALPEPIRALLALAPSRRDPRQAAELRAYFRTKVSPEGKRLGDRLAALKKSRDEIEKQVPSTMVMQEMATPRDTFVLMRGQYDKPGAKVTAGVPSFLPPLPAGAPANRLGLARWLVDPSHPLTSRVAVNRYWQLIFGTGLVKTAEDFGSRGEPPSHPELLDWLAAEFLAPAHGGRAWDVKGLIRLLVTSAAYRQSSAVTPELRAKDPENRLLARGVRSRLQAEFIRDGALAAAGLLDGRIGGASVFPYQPAGLWEELMSRSDGANWSAQSYTPSHGRDLYRRTMYTFWKRTSPPPTLATFDAPDRETCTVHRARTNTPLQALVLLNDPTYVEASRKLAERMIHSGPSADDRLTFAFRLATARLPRPAELEVLRSIVAESHARYRKEPDTALKLLSVGESPHDPSLDPAELAAWTTAASVILNLDETVTKG